MIKKPKTSLKGLDKAVCSKTETGAELSSLKNPTIQQKKQENAFLFKRIGFP